jgi:integrase
MKLTQRAINALDLPAGKTDAIYFDDTLHGFGVRLREGGTRMYVVQYKIGGKQRRITIGSTAQLTAEAARTKASTILLAVRTGTDPQAERATAKARAGDVFVAIAKRYLARQKVRLRPNSYMAVERYILTHFEPLHLLPLAHIDRRIAAERLSNIAAERGPASANRARATLSAFFSWSWREGLVEANPVAATNKQAGDIGRDRVLSIAELAEVWRAAGDNAYGAIVRLLVLTGQRRAEIGSLRWSEIDFAAQLIRLPAERTKNKRAHEVPLSEAAAQLLNTMSPHGGEFVFGAVSRVGFNDYSKQKFVLDERITAARQVAGVAPMAPWVLHDLRRSVATHMAEIGIQPHIVEAVLNHTSGHKAGIAGVYNKAAYDRAKRTALALWADHVMALVDGRATNVVSILSGGAAAPSPSRLRLS